MNSAPVTPKPFNERLLLWILSAIHFTAMMDFLIIMPLGPQYMRVFHITTAQFGLMVSAYTISAGIAGLVAGLFIDRFDRKPAMLWLYAGFALGTFFCAVAPGFYLLVAARSMAGAFAGVAGSVMLAVIGDAIPHERRGAAMGMVMSAFSVASICGVPAGTYLAAHLDWHAPFYILTALSVVVLIAAWRFMPHIHVTPDETEQHPIARMIEVFFHKDHQVAFLMMILLTGTGFLIVPYLSPYLVANVGLTEAQLPLVYLCGGFCTFFSMNLIGRWADIAGKRKVFTIMSVLVAVPIFVVTNLSRVPLAVALVFTTLFMICMSGRYVPAMALITGSIEARYRGGFMSVNSAVQQFATGTITYLGGLLIGKSPTGELTRFPVAGIISVFCALACVYASRFLRRPAESEAAAQVTME